MRIFSFLISSLAILLLSSTVAANNYYKWTDKNGVVHYSQKAPQGLETEVVTTKTPPGAGSENVETENVADDTDANDDIADTDTEEGTGEGEEGEEGGEAEDGEAETAGQEVATKDTALCERARNDKTVLISNPIVRLEGKVMTVEEKNEKIQQMNEIISIHCD